MKRQMTGNHVATRLESQGPLHRMLRANLRVKLSRAVFISVIQGFSSTLREFPKVFFSEAVAAEKEGPR